MDISQTALGYVQALMWPLVVVAGLTLFRRQLAPLIQGVRKVTFPGGSIDVEPPRAIKEGTSRQATGEGTSGAELPADAEKYFEVKSIDPAGALNVFPQSMYLLHSARRLESQTADGKYWYEIRMWVEADDEGILDRCRRVTYKLDPTFPQPIIATEQRGREFELWLRAWGEFTVFAYIEQKDNRRVLVSRYLDLPGRPPY